MVKHDQSPTPHQQSAKFSFGPLKRPSIKVADVGDESGVQISRTDNNQTCKRSNSPSSEMLSTAELISAVGQIWDCASRSLTRFQPRADPNCSDSINHRGKEILYVVDDDNVVAVDVIDDARSHVQSNTSRCFPNIVRQSLECMRTVRKIRYRPCEDNYIQDFLMGIGRNSSTKHHASSKGKSLADVGITYALMNRNRWQSQINRQGKHCMSMSMETMKIIQSMSESTESVCSPLSATEEILSRNFRPTSLSPRTDTYSMKDQFSSGKLAEIKYRNLTMSSWCSNYILQVVQNTHHSACMSTALSLAKKSCANLSDPVCTHEADNRQSVATDFVEDDTMRFEDSNIEGESQSQSESSVPVMRRRHRLLAKQEHAVSGALSGIVVSLCLHPIDTVKTVLQSCQAGPKSLSYIGQSIIAERGLSGLYRGISSNISSSAPISALYTFTYESVKGILLPSLAKEYHSIAHCTAGGCASIATSFIFTPSDHLKQQMQVNSKYQNCWNAALRIIEKGGLLSLYAGWGAVLCRNIPHSIIKFYTYESLKQMFISSELPDNQLRASQTLLCGGLAGSAAALFSTPFDVVKTRLQTQMPGSAKKYLSIMNVLHQIRDQEGVKGLYRGLIPRLIMYMSQGALFFASYEFFKSLVSLDLARDNSEMLQYKQDTDGDTLLPV